MIKKRKPGMILFFIGCFICFISNILVIACSVNMNRTFFILGMILYFIAIVIVITAVVIMIKSNKNKNV